MFALKVISIILVGAIGARGKDALNVQTGFLKVR
jgi:hypothetical protein